MPIFPLILCGGSGTRLWPASSPARPKQFLPLLGPRSMFQDTALRCAPLGERMAVVAGEAHVEAITRQLAEIGVTATILVEPQARDSGPAVAAAAAWVMGQDPDGVALMVASDHYVGDDPAFRASVLNASRAAAGGRIVTFGVRPTEPSSAYGYIRPAGAPVDGVAPVERFVEKPTAEVARGYLADGYLWNSGNFVFAAATLLAELDRHCPAMARAARLSVQEGEEHEGVLRLGPSFRDAPKLSVDYAVMEPTDRASVAAVDFPWSDLGAWDAVWAASARDDNGNAGGPRTLFDDASDCLVKAPPEVTVALAGVRDLVVVVEPHAVLVCDRAASQSVKALSARAAEQPALSPPLAQSAEALERWLRTAALPLWWSLGADHAGGGFHEALTLDGRPVAAPRRARVQARQVQVYAQAALDGWTGPAEAAARHGLRSLVDRYRRPDGLFATLPGSEIATVYDQAFALFALAAADPVIGGDCEAMAHDVLAGLASRRHAAGGYVEHGDHAFQANPHMHLLEAALAWDERRPNDERWMALADEIVDLALTRWIDPASGAIREFFTDAWTPAPGVDGLRIEPGHQFEWAWLLSRWSERRGHHDARRAARRLYEAGRRGVDATRGVAVDALDLDGEVVEPTARLWPQTERLRAALAFGEEADAASAAGALLRYLDVPVTGAWRDRMRPDGGFVAEPSPASSLYHLAGAIRALRA